MTETPAAVDEIAPFLVGDVPIYLKRPTTGQLLFIYLLAGIDPDQDTPASMIDAMKSFVAVMSYLVVSPREVDDEQAMGWGKLKEGVLSGELGLEHVMGVAQGAVEKWGDPDEVERNRAERRAVSRRPAAKAVARPTRGRR